MKYRYHASFSLYCHPCRVAFALQRIFLGKFTCLSELFLTVKVYHECAGHDMGSKMPIQLSYDLQHCRTAATVLKRSKSKTTAFILIIYQFILHLLVFTEHYVCVHVCVYLCSNCVCFRVCLCLSPLCLWLLVCACVLQCVLLDGRRDLLPSRSGWGGEFLRVPAGLLVHKPGIACPHKHVEVAKHLEE